MQGKKIYIVGIGGIGLSALAQLYKSEGAEVSGSDRSVSPTTELLQSKGISVFIGSDPAHVPADADLLVYSDAVLPGSESFIERSRGKELGIREQSYFEALGEVANKKKVIAIAGAHGKTTTTAMLIDVLEDAQLDPTAVVGSLRSKTKSNFREGRGEYFVVEADEYMRHFLNFKPYILVITNIDADHLDYYKDIADIQSAFHTLAQKVPQDGFVVCDVMSETVKPVIEGLSCTVVDYKKFFDAHLEFKGLSFNKINASAVLAVANILKIDQSSAKKTLADFTGTWRRFEYKGKTSRGALVYDDYAHHPQEVSITLKSVREKYPNKRIIVAFHPHLYSRSKMFLNDFVSAFMNADEVLVAPIFAAREVPDPTISNEIIVAAMKARGADAHAVSLEDVASYISNETGEGDVVITMGAGDIYKAAEEALQ